MKTDDRLDFHSAVLGLLFIILKRGQSIDNRPLIATFSITVAPLSSLAAFDSCGTNVKLTFPWIRLLLKSSCLASIIGTCRTDIQY